MAIENHPRGEQKMKRKVITICCSASFYKETLDIEKELKKLGFIVKVPKTVSVMKRNNNFDVESHKTWYKNKLDYKKKTQLIKQHFKKIIESDAILVLNLDKKGIKGYIGGNTLMEMTIAFHYKKPIFVYNPISDNSNIKEEIYGMDSVFLNGDLELISV